MNNVWKKIETAPTDGRQILVGFVHPQGGVIVFTARAYGDKTWAPNYAPPTHWTEIPVGLEEAE